MCLVEKGEHLVARLELSHTATNGFDGTGTVGTGNHVVCRWEGIFALQVYLVVGIAS